MKHEEETTETATLEAVLSRDNLQAAWLVVKANQGAAGVDGLDIEQTKSHLREHWEAIEAKLRCGEYTPAAVRAVEIPKPNGGLRTLGIPNVQDRMIQQAIHQALSPLWEAEFSEHSYGFRANRSAHDAIRAAQGYIQAGKTWVVDIDLKSFFDEVNHDILMRRISEKVRDKRLLRLIGDYLRAPMQTPDRRRTKRTKGTPQGGPTDRSALLGFRLYSDGRTGVSPKALKRMEDQVRRLWDARQSLTSNQLRDQWRRYVDGWWNYFKLADWRREVEDTSGWIRRHMRKCFWQRWKTPRGRIQALKRLGVNARAQGIGYTGLGAWAVARSRAMHQALKVATLNRYGLIVPWDFAEANR